MSRNGTHPVLTKAQARALYLPGACKDCVYYARVSGRPRESCDRCGSRPSRRLSPLELEANQRTRPITTSLKITLRKPST